MSREEQKEFVTEILSETISNITKKIDDGKIPSDWDGFELRQYIEDFAKYQINYIQMPKGRKRDYNNDCIINNL